MPPRVLEQGFDKDKSLGREGVGFGEGEKKRGAPFSRKVLLPFSNPFPKIFDWWGTARREFRW